MSEVIDATVVELSDTFTKMDEVGATEIATVSETVKKPDEEQFSEEETKIIEGYMSQIDICDSQFVLSYGAASQKDVADFSEGVLESVRTKDLGEVGGMISNVVAELKGFNVEEEKGGIFGFFKKGSGQLKVLKAKYSKAEANVDAICKAMEGHQMILLKDAAMLDKMYEKNLEYFRQLTLYIAAGKRKLEEAKTKVLPELVAKSEQTGLQEDAQAARDYAAMIERFEKKIYDLELTRNIAMQMAPQIRLVQNNDTVMAEKIQSTLVNTIPLWKSQMVIAIGIGHSQEAAKAQREVTDMTNELLMKNAQNLKMATIESAKESERGIVDIETLTATNQTLIETLDEVMQIQKDGRERRKNAEIELGRIENEMKDKIIEISKESMKVE